MVGICLQDWPCIETALGKCILIMKSSIYRVNRSTQPSTTPISASFYTGHEGISADM